MTIRLSHAQARALEKLDRITPLTPAEIGETEATCNALVIAGYAKRDADVWGSKYVKIKEVW